jgi:hypothetical protein
MGLPARQQRVLEAIEDSLRACEPQLASMYAIFTRLTRGEPRPFREQLPDQRRGLRSWPVRIRLAMAHRRGRARELPRPAAPGRPRPLMRRQTGSGPRRPLLRLLFIGQLMAILAVLGVLIGLGSSMTPAACATRAARQATAAQSHLAMASCRGELGK